MGGSFEVQRRKLDEEQLGGLAEYIIYANCHASISIEPDINNIEAAIANRVKYPKL